MSEENVEVVRRVYEAFNERDADEAVELVSPRFSFQSEFGALSGRRDEGRAGFRNYFRDMADAWAAFQVELDEIEALGEAVIVAYRERAIGRGSGIEVEAHGYELWRFEHGQLVSKQNFASKERALEAAGLSA
jgi:ketosteroid isomerase-like protein